MPVAAVGVGGDRVVARANVVGGGVVLRHLRLLVEERQQHRRLDVVEAVRRGKVHRAGGVDELVGVLLDVADDLRVAGVRPDLLHPAQHDAVVVLPGVRAAGDVDGIGPARHHRVGEPNRQARRRQRSVAAAGAGAACAAAGARMSRGAAGARRPRGATRSRRAALGAAGSAAGATPAPLPRRAGRSRGAAAPGCPTAARRAAAADRAAAATAGARAAGAGRPTAAARADAAPGSGRSAAARRPVAPPVPLPLSPPEASPPVPVACPPVPPPFAPDEHPSAAAAITGNQRSDERFTRTSAPFTKDIVRRFVARRPCFGSFR